MSDSNKSHSERLQALIRQSLPEAIQHEVDRFINRTNHMVQLFLPDLLREKDTPLASAIIRDYTAFCNSKCCALDGEEVTINLESIGANELETLCDLNNAITEYARSKRSAPNDD